MCIAEEKRENQWEVEDTTEPCPQWNKGWWLIVAYRKFNNKKKRLLNGEATNVDIYSFYGWLWNVRVLIVSIRNTGWHKHNAWRGCSVCEILAASNQGN